MKKFEELNGYINNGEFNNAKQVFDNVPFEKFREFIISREYKSEKEIVFYQFVEYLIFEKETAELHELASVIMGFCLNWMPGSYYLGMHHQLKSIELEPENLDSKKMLMFYFEVPERPLSIEKARFYANQILEIDPEYESAHRVLTMIKTMEERNEN